MLVATVLLILGSFVGWRRAVKRGGSTPDCVQYAMVHGIAGFLIGMIGMTILWNMGYLNP